MNRLYLFIVLLSISFSQWFTINHQGIDRMYYVSFPESNIEPSSLIINMHGYGGTALQQQTYTQMDYIANSQNIAVVYPQGLNYSWNVFTYWDGNPYDDVGFISSMIDDISENYNIDLNKVYACGMSNGGYMAYRLACDLSDKITAFGSVTGNFMLNSSQNDCQDQEREIPIIHLHGTSDTVVNYYPPSFDQSLTVGQSIDFWNNYNNLDVELIESLNSNVDIYTYSKDLSSTKFLHYKVIGGGHEWFGGNWGFNTNSVLIDFFNQYQLSDFINNQLLEDLNEDGVINIQDVILIVSLILNNQFDINGDINNDGDINVIDIIIIVDIIIES